MQTATAEFYSVPLSVIPFTFSTFCKGFSTLLMYFYRLVYVTCHLDVCMDIIAYVSKPYKTLKNIKHKINLLKHISDPRKQAAL